MIVTTPLHTPASAPPEFDESATRDPVEVLIKEARNRARRRRLVIGAVTAASVAVAAIAVTAAIDGGPPQSQGVAVDPQAWPASFGVFELARGRIVFPDSGELKAIDPTDPSSVVALDLPSGQSAHTPAGWSADGTKLALTSEHSGTSTVMDADGQLTRVPRGGGCCWFVTGPWLSPDGTSSIEAVAGDRLRVNDVEGFQPSRVIELDPPVGDLDTGVVPITAWSPDGARIAYAVYDQVGKDMLPSVYIVDLETGDARQLVGQGFGHIRQMAWSPDGSQLLVIAGPWRQTNPESRSLNPLTSPKETGLYLVNADGDILAMSASALHPIASGHYVAAAWSPDGEQIAAVDFAGSGRRLVVMSSDGSASRVLADLPANDLFTGVAWHPGPRE